ncbi:MAG: hypothetical protein KDM81_05870, partial [Verrucomicrobiae bacterium]|nr:hypothetical protein [Verrucomicrobiae bacterium]
WMNPDTHRTTAVSNARLAELCRGLLAIAVEGEPVQYQINRLPTGWVVELVNNRGVAKQKDQAAVVDPTAVARVILKPRFPCVAIKAWRAGASYPGGAQVTVEVGPGATEFVEFVAAP